MSGGPAATVTPGRAVRLTPAEQRRNRLWLYVGRALRSFVTAFLTVVFPLYLAAEGKSATVIGALLTVGGVVSALLMAAAGLLGDRIGRRVVLAVLGLLGALGAFGMAVTSNLAVVMVANGLGGVGRGGGAGSGGSWGPYFPVEQPLLAESVSDADRTRAFGEIGFVGVLAGAAGSLVAFLPSVLRADGLSELRADRLVFLLGGVLSLGIVAAVVPLVERRRAGAEPAEARAAVAPSAEGPRPAEAEAALGGSLSTRALIGRLGLTNALNGLGFGFLGPLLTYWFHVRFGVGAASLGLLYTVINLVTALPYLGAAGLARRLGAVRAVVATRVVSVGALVAMIFAPSFAIAGALFAFRMAANSLGLPARQSFTMGVADERRRGTVAAFSSLPSLLTSSVSPVVGGALMGALLATPLIGAALFMGLNTVAYYFAFRRTRPPEEVARPPGGGARTERDRDRRVREVVEQPGTAGPGGERSDA